MWLHVTMYLMCDPRQLFFFQCGAETPEGWTPLPAEENFQNQPVSNNWQHGSLKAELPHLHWQQFWRPIQLESSLEEVTWGLHCACIRAQLLPLPSPVSFPFLPHVLIPRALSCKCPACNSLSQFASQRSQLATTTCLTVSLVCIHHVEPSDP